MRPMTLCAAPLLLLAVACGDAASQKSDTKIGNGKEVGTDSDTTRAVVMLAGPSGRGHCTGTLLNDTTMITAVHCLLNYQTGGIHLETPDGLVASKRAFFADRARVILERSDELDEKLAQRAIDRYSDDPACGEDDDPEFAALEREAGQLMDELPQHDVALVVFPAGTGDAITGGAGYYGIAERAPASGDQMLFVGFGHASATARPAEGSCGMTLAGEGFGTKRQGTNVVGSASGGTVEATGYASRAHASDAGVAAGEDVSVRPGDSGGPWVACSGAGRCDAQRLFGINSTGSFRGAAQEISTGADATSRASKALYARAINCGGSHCAADFEGSGLN